MAVETFENPMMQPSAVEQGYDFKGNFEQAPSEAEAYNFGTDTSTVVATNVAQQRAAKWHFGLGEDSPGAGPLLSSIVMGTEDAERRNQAIRQSLRDEQVKSQLIEQHIKASGGKIDQGTIAMIKAASTDDLQSPEALGAYFEKRYAERYLTSAVAHMIQTSNAGYDAKDFWEREPEKANQMMDFASHVLTIKEGAQRIAEGLEAKYDNTSWTGKVVPKLERFVNPIFDARLKTDFFSLRGNNLTEQYNAIYTMATPGEAIARIKATAEEIYQKNPEAALEWIRGITSYSTANRLWDNVMTMADYAPVTGVVPYKMFAKPGLAFANLMKTSVGAAGNRTLNVANALQAAGDVWGAAAARAVSVGENIDDIYKSLPTIANPKAVLEGGTPNLALSAQQAITRQLERGNNALRGALNDMVRLNRLQEGELAFETAKAEAKKTWDIENPRIAANVVDVSVSNLEEGLTSARYLKIQLGERVAKESVEATGARDVLARVEKPGATSKYKQVDLTAANTNDNGAVYAVRGDTTTPPFKMESANANQVNQNRLWYQARHKALSDAVEATKETGPGGKKAVAWGDRANAERELKNFERQYKKELSGPVEYKGNTGAPGQVTKGFEKLLKPANLNEGGEAWVASKITGDAEAKALKSANDNIKITVTGHDLKPFSSREAAERAAREDFGLTKYKVVEQANGYTIQVVKAVDETLSSVRNALAIDLEKTGAPKIPLQVFLGRLVSKDSTLSEAMLENLKTAAHGSKQLVEAMEIAAEPIRELRNQIGKTGKKSWDDFVTFIDRQKQAIDSKGQIGRYSENQGGFEADWMREFKRMPTEQESAAYWSYVNVMDNDLAINNLGIHRDKTRAGLGMYGFASKQEAEGLVNARTNSLDARDPRNKVELTAANDAPLKADIEGRLAREIPWDSKELWNLAVWSEKGEHTLWNKTDFTGKQGRALRDTLDNGLSSGQFRLVQLSPEGEKAFRAKLPDHLKKQFEDRIHFVVTDGELKSEPLGLRHLSRREGGHQVYDYQWMVSQPDLKTNKGAMSTRTTYMGDLNLFGANTEKDGLLFIERWNKAREMLKNNDPMLPHYLSANLPIDEVRFREIYNRGTYDINTPVMLRPMNTNLDQYHKLGDTYMRNNPHHQFVRASDGEFNLYRDVNLRFAMERNEPLAGIEVDHSPTNPTIQVRRGDMLDPVVTMDRAAKSIMNSVYLHDVKAQAIENFIAQYSDVLAWDIAQLRRDPLAALMHAPFKSNADPAAIWAAKDFRRTTLELLSIKSETQTAIDGWLQKTKESILGPTVGKWVDDHELSFLKDPVRYMRSAAFNLKIGLFNPASFFQQAMVVSHITGVEGPARATKAGAMAIYNKLLSRTTDENIIKQWAVKQEALTGMKADHFLEAVQGLERSGYGKVGNEVSDMGYWDSPKVIQTKMGKVLEYGRMPFTLGEGLGRQVGWFAAYDRWRALNPTRKFDDAAVREVLNRADLLNLNMSSVSNADWQKGILGIPTQFFGVHTRLIEQALGKRLTPGEIARVFAVNSTLFGIPTAVGGYAALWPVGESVKESMLDKGYRPEENVLTDIMVNGVPSVVSKYVTGVQYDFSRLGMGGLSAIKDAVDGKRGMFETMGGVSGKVLSDILASTDPLMSVLKSVGTGELYPVTSQDFVNVARNVGGYSAFEKMIMAVARQEHINKTDQKVHDIDAWNGMIMGLTGTQPLAVADMYRMMNDKKALNGLQQKQEKEFGQNRRWAIEALNRGDTEGFKTYMTRAEVALIDGRFRPDQISKLVARADDSNTGLLTKTQESFYKQDPSRIEGWFYDLRNNPKKQ